MSASRQPLHAQATGYYAIVVAVFCGLLIISNVAATKLFVVGGRIFDGGAFLFPLVYVVGDLLSEVYGLRATRRAIFLGFALCTLAALTFLVVQAMPPAPTWPHQEAFEAILGFVPRIVFASLAAFVCGQLLNAWVLVRIKARTDEPRLWLRLIGSTIAGEALDTLVFCTIAFYGVVTGTEFLNYLVTGFVLKVAVEVLVLPVTYRVVALLKRHEPTYGRDLDEAVSVVV